MRKRLRNRGVGHLMPVCLGLVISWMLLGAVETLGAGSPLVYKAPRPRKDIKPMGTEAAYAYDRGDKVDPFLSFLIKRENVLREIEEDRKRKFEALERLKSLKAARTELQKLDISQLTLTAIIQSKDKTYALVTDPKGMGHVIKEGTPIGTNGGVVDQILREETKTPYGKQYVRKVIIKEPHLDENQEKIVFKFIEMKMPEKLYD